jgi:hypothetical protein
VHGDEFVVFFSFVHTVKCVSLFSAIAFLRL